MEDLTKHQLILLTLLVSFVTSIATGIITFTMLQEAPVEITNTINRVVERTIEQVTPADGGKTTVKEVQVVNEEDLILSSISKSVGSIVRVKTTGVDGVEAISGLGLIISEKGYIVIDGRSYNPNAANYIILSDGVSYSPEKVFVDSANGLVFLKLSMVGHSKDANSFAPISLGDSNSLKLGQSLIRIGGRASNSVSVGRISELAKSADGKTNSKINTDIRTNGTLPGSPSFNLSGELVGLEATSEGEVYHSFSPINSLKDPINQGISELSK